MTIKYTRDGNHEDGSPRFRIESDDPAKTLVYVGPHIQGPVTLADGTVYDVSPHIIEVTRGHELLVSDAIGERYMAEGHPLHDDSNPFVHIPSTVTHGDDGAPAQAFADAVEAHTPPHMDSSPQAVADTARKG